MVEQNAKKGLEFADIGYVLVSGNLALAWSGDELLANPAVGRPRKARITRKPDARR